MQPPLTRVPDRTPSVLPTPRLLLRPLRAPDAQALHALLLQPGVRRFLCDDRALAPDEAARMAATSATLHARTGAGLWAFERNAQPGHLAGFAGLWPFEHRGAPPREELVFALAEQHWGQGFAAEGCDALLAHARDHLRRAFASATTDPGNGASVRTLRRLGFIETGVVQGDAGRLLRGFERTL